MSNEAEEEAIWHLLIWAILANQRDIAELFLYETSCKLGKLPLEGRVKNIIKE